MEQMCILAQTWLLHNRLGILDKESSFSKQPVFSSDLDIR